MVQKEIQRKTRAYGIAAILCAIILVSVIYTYGSNSMFIPNQSSSQSENQPITQSQDLPDKSMTNIPIIQQVNGQGMKTFLSLEELERYINNTSNSYNIYQDNSGSLSMPRPVPTSVPAAVSGGALESNSYSTTNIQVAGVDEADTVKTDGQYIYTVSSINGQNPVVYYSNYYSPQTHNYVSIIKADPKNPAIVSKIDIGNDTQQAQLYLSSDNNRLIVIGSKYDYSYGYGAPSPQATAILPPYFENQYTFITVYDISNKANPILTRNFTVTGNYFNSRMIGNYVYAIVSQSATIYNDNGVTLPTIYNGKSAYPVPATSVYYSNMTTPSYYQFTSFFGIDALSDNEQPTNMTILMGGASTMYVSQNNIYITYPVWNYVSTWNSYGSETTSIYRVSISGAKLTFEAQGNVSGNVINQYAMDENNGYFRIATNSHAQMQTNNLYVLDSTLTIVGRLEGLAQNENLNSVRFMGDKCYLVTFIKTDPLFVIDLSQPRSPKVLGELQISGYSDYLHPYDETHLIGLGKETVDSNAGDFAWYQGLKLALFDVSAVNNPQQLSKYIIGDRGTDSLALSDPKAFLFDKASGLLVIPVNLAKVENSTGQATAWSYGQMVWQGAYVFSVNINGGFTLKGTITHLNETTLAQLQTSQVKSGSTSSSSTIAAPVPGFSLNSIYNQQDQYITRALYIGNTLYTISNSEIKLNSLSDLTQITQLNLN